MSTDAASNAMAGADNGPKGPNGSEPAAPNGSATPPVRPRSGKAAWIVIGGAMLIGAVLGASTYFRAAGGAEGIGAEMRAARERGATIEAEGCVANTLDWFEKRCDAPGRMCIDAVPKVVGECLAARDRSDTCKALGNDEKPSQWAYNRCKQRGIDRSSKKGIKESCTQAWRALDSWCKSGQKGVAL